MNPKMVLTVTGIFEVIFAIGIFFGAGGLASDGIPEISEQALWLESTFVEVMAAMSLGTGIILLLKSGDRNIWCQKSVDGSWNQFSHNHCCCDISFD